MWHHFLYTDTCRRHMTRNQPGRGNLSYVYLTVYQLNGGVKTTEKSVKGLTCAEYLWREQRTLLWNINGKILAPLSDRQQNWQRLPFNRRRTIYLPLCVLSFASISRFYVSAIGVRSTMILYWGVSVSEYARPKNPVNTILSQKTMNGISGSLPLRSSHKLFTAQCCLVCFRWMTWCYTAV